jgi:hypothetical protein
MAMKVSLSFKSDEKEMYDYLMQQLSTSIYIKSLLKKEMEKGPEQDRQKKHRNILDF